VEIRFYIDPETDEPHIHRHAVEETEVEEILSRPSEDRPGQDNSRVAVGQTKAGRHLRVVYVPDASDRSIFVVTAYEPGRKVIQALRRRRRRRR
jgi:hypothetical protein